MIHMALCTRCGRQAESGTEFCSGCGTYSAPAAEGQPVTASAMGTADYLRPFAPEGTGHPALPEIQGPDRWSDPAGGWTAGADQQAWSDSSPSVEVPAFSRDSVPAGESPLPARQPFGSAQSTPPGGDMSSPEQDYPGGSSYFEAQAAGAYLPEPGQAFAAPGGRRGAAESASTADQSYVASEESRRAAADTAAEDYAATDQRYAAKLSAGRSAGAGEPYATAGERYATAGERYAATGELSADPSERYAADHGERYAGSGELYADHGERYAGPGEHYADSGERDAGADDPLNAAEQFYAATDHRYAAENADLADSGGHYLSASADVYGTAGPDQDNLDSDERYAPVNGGPASADPPYDDADQPYSTADGYPANSAPWSTPGPNGLDDLSPSSAPTSYPSLTWAQQVHAQDVLDAPHVTRLPLDDPDLDRADRGDAVGLLKSGRRRLRRPARNLDPDEDYASPEYAGPPSTDQAGRREFVAEQPRSPVRGRWVAFAATAVVVIIAAAGAAILLAHHSKPNRQTASSQKSRIAQSAPKPSASPTKVSGGLITVTPGAAAAPHAAAVEAFLTRYFRAINNHDYAAYRRLFEKSLRGGLSQSAFTSGYGSSQDSQATLHGITVPAAGQLDAAVSFTSHQEPTASATNTSCTVWSISLYLTRQGHTYVIESPPAGYQATSSACP